MGAGPCIRCCSAYVSLIVQFVKFPTIWEFSVGDGLLSFPIFHIKTYYSHSLSHDVKAQSKKNFLLASIYLYLKFKTIEL